MNKDSVVWINETQQPRGLTLNKESTIKTSSQFAFSFDLYTLFLILFIYLFIYFWVLTMLISMLTYSKFSRTKVFSNPETHGDQVKDFGLFTALQS